MFTHMMPFYSYDIPHTCGPDPKICCQFDFKRLPNHGLHCPWKVPPQVITEKNVAERAQLLLDQYRKKSKLFKTNVLLAPLGDDFRYDHPTEWDVQYNNYQLLFDYMNSNLNLNVKAQFGTLSDYFAAVRKEMKISEFPVLSGDFFTYADRDDHYWSGYYTSKPFYKRMDRVLLSYIRSAEVIYALAHLSKKPGSSWIVDKENGLGKLISNARLALSLFQHHDGITGTAKDYVVVDYGKKMLSAINGCQRIIQICAHILLNGLDAEIPEREANYYNVDDVRHSHDALPEHYQITIGVPELRTKRIVIYNSLTFTRHEVVTFYVSTPFIEVCYKVSSIVSTYYKLYTVFSLLLPINVKYYGIVATVLDSQCALLGTFSGVTDFQGKVINCQVSPVFEYGSTMSLTKFQLSFIANIPALGLVSYTVNALLEQETPKETAHAQVKILNHYGDVQAPKGFAPEVSPSTNEFTLQNNRVTASFSNLGLLKALKIRKTTVPVHLDFAKYGVRMRHNSDSSGAYLFLPDKEDAVPLQIENVAVNIIEGPIVSSVTVQLPYVHHTATLYNTPGNKTQLAINI
ncbi:hypothetical protein NQ318_018917 [Aromia moschata]|uniref:mannosyl-oligosaccharide 1,3-1,6-alpha-mannosidase n=1 Tax=Aromia moschata TaxID=1265417 RepID=A0AAV8ZJB1_9CUCU|nr:hypothetical protein NQ318_018917 [Aromia moschata]